MGYPGKGKVNNMRSSVYLLICGEPFAYYREDYLDEMRPIEETWEDRLSEELEEDGIDYTSLKGARIA